MKIALIQQQATKDCQENLKRGIESFRQAAGYGAKLIAFAELAFCPFYPQRRAESGYLEKAETIPGPTTDVFQALAEEYGVVVVLNIFERDGKRAFDSSPVIDADGNC